MRILLAVDGSACSDRATELVSTFPLPPDSVVRVVAVHRPYADVLGLGWEPMGDASTNEETEDEADARRLREAIAGAELAIRRPGIHVEGFLLRGRPGSAIVDEAREAGRTSSSSAAGVTDGSPPCCWVVRHPRSWIMRPAPCSLPATSTWLRSPSRMTDRPRPATPRRCSLAGPSSPACRSASSRSPSWRCRSPPASRPACTTRRWSPTRRPRTRPARRSGARPPPRLTVSPTPASMRPRSSSRATRRRRSCASPRTTVSRPSSMGTRGRTGLTRLILGSTARNVLLHASCSVLVVRQGK